MPNILWPRVRTAQVGHAGLIGRLVHWLGVAIAIGLLVTALGFVADGWLLPVATGLAAAAVVSALGGRGVRYLLARE